MCDHRNLSGLAEPDCCIFLFLRQICFECAAKIPTGSKCEVIFANRFKQSYVYARLDVYQTV